MSLAVMQADNFDGLFDYNAEFVTLYSPGTVAINVGDFVAFLSNNTGNPGAIEGMSIDAADLSNAYAINNIFGIAMGLASGGPAAVAGTQIVAAGTAGNIRVQIAGRNTVANVDSGCTQGLAIVCSTTAGRGDPASGVSTNDYRVVATSLSAVTSNVATVLIHPHPNFIR